MSSKQVLKLMILCCINGFPLIVASEASSGCMADCTSLLTPHPPSLYEQYCCILSNSGKKFKLKENNRVKIIFCPPYILPSCSRYHSCNALLDAFPIAESGYYSLIINGSSVTVYCDMEGSNCDGKGGWMRVGYLNMSEPNATCPLGLTLRQFNNINHGLCGQQTGAGQQSTFFSTHGISYSKVCGRLRGYQFGTPDGFPPLYGDNASPDIEKCHTYIDGVSITYDSNPRKHIWSYASGISEGDPNFREASCPCNSGNEDLRTNIPAFVGNDYYCESALQVNMNIVYTLLPNDILWDGHQCGGLEGSCCMNPNMPWFIKTLNETTTKDIELRMCGSEDSVNEDTPLDIIELYIC